METIFFSQFEIIINVLVSFVCFILIPMLKVYVQYKYFTLSVREFRRQKSVSTLAGLSETIMILVFMYM